METQLSARQVVETFLAEIGEETLDARIDLDDPLDVALAGSRELLRRGLQLRQEAGTRGAGAAQGVVDTLWPARVRRRYPTHEAESLMILAWAARCELTPSEKGPWPRPTNLVWANRTLRRILGESETVQGTSASGRHPSRDLSTFLMQDLGGQELGGLSDKTSRILQQFWLALYNAPRMVIDTPLEDLRREGGTATFTPECQAKRYAPEIDDEGAVEIFRQCFFLGDGSFHVVVGARTFHPGGVRLGFATKDDARFAKFYDLYAVWNLEIPDRATGKIDPASFLSLQGLFIPVDLRRELYDRVSEMTRQLQTAALVSKNLSHNLGSHALLHVSGALAFQESGANEPVTRGDLAALLQYLVQRADIVAMLSSGPGHLFSVTLPLRAVVDAFNRQKLLHRYLCATEELEVNEVDLAAEAIDVDVPGGLVGGQALCAILENFARNSAKHSRRLERSRRLVELHLEAKKVADGRVLCRLSDKNAEPIDAEQLIEISKAVDTLLSQRERLRGWNAGSVNGLGLEEIATWASYLRRGASGDSVPSNSPLLEYRQDEPSGRLCLLFYLDQARSLRELSPDELGRREISLPAQLTLVRCPSRAQFEEQPRQPPGRWLTVFKEATCTHFRSRFEQFTSDDERWSEIESADEPVRANATLSAYLESLRRFAMPSGETLHLILIDQGFFTRARDGGASAGAFRAGEKRLLYQIATPLGGLQCYVCREYTGKEKEKNHVELAELAGELPEGKLAIWKRHNGPNGGWLRSLTSDPLARRIVHYEFYEDEGGNPYRMILRPELLQESDKLAFLFGLLAESALLRGHIVDERFSKIYLQDKNLRERLLWMGIRLIDPFAAPGELGSLLQRLDTPQADVEGWPGARVRCSFTSIHASLRRSREVMGDTPWRDLLWDQLQRFPIVALHSGRGGVEEIEDLSCPFLPASFYQSCVFEMPCKLFFTEALMRGGRL